MVSIVARAAGLFLVVAMTSSALAQQPTRDGATPQEGTASVAGIVMRSDGPKGPLRRARVTLTGASLANPIFTTTDDDGSFEVGGLAPGQYALAASKAGYLTMNLGATRPARMGTSVIVKGGDRVAGLTLSLPRAASIEGTVTNASGEPMPDAYVAVLRRAIDGGEPRLIGVGSGAFTDDRGAYRAYGLEPGDYLVSVQPVVDARDSADMTRISDGDVDRALQQARQAAQAPAGDRPAPPSRLIGYAPVFHPDSSDAARATLVTLAEGEERSGIDIRVDLVPMARIDGTVSNADGTVASPLQVFLASLGPPVPDEAYGYGGRLGPKTPDAQGRFMFAGVPPGEYSLIATTRPRPQPAGRGGGAAAPPPSTTSLLAAATVVVNGVDQAVALTLQPGLTLSGRFIFEGTTSATGLPGARLQLEDLRVDQSGSLRLYAGEAAPDGTFRIADILPGRFRISNETIPNRPPQSGWALKSVTVTGREVLDAPFELRTTDRLSDVVVTFTDHPSELSGALQNLAGTPTSDYFIVVFPTDPAQWFPHSRRIASTRPNTAGAYRIRNIPPGDYFIAALTDVATGEWFNPTFLQALQASAIRLTIGDGEKKTQDLRVVR